MKIKEKSWLWYLTFPFAHKNFTTIWDTIYCPKGMTRVPGFILEHERIHYEQQQRWGKPLLLLWISCYLLIFPLFFNPFRYRWEYEAFRKGSGYSHDNVKHELADLPYGLLPYWLHCWCLWGLRP
jgi:hypothetical protein